MLIIFIIAGFAIIAFVIGFALVYQGYASLPRPDDVASSEELEKTKAELKTSNAESEKLKTQANTLAVQLEEMKAKLTWAEENVKALEEMNNATAQTQTKLDQVEKDLNFLSQKADSQARESIDVITSLSAECDSLKLKLSQAPAVSPAEVTGLKDENQKLKIQLDGYINKVKELEANLEAGQKIAEAAKASAQLSEENAALKKSLTELEDKIRLLLSEAETNKSEQAKAVSELQIKIAALETENKELRERPVEVKPSFSDEEVLRLRQENEERIVLANAALVKLNSDLELVNSRVAEKDSLIKKLNEDLLTSRQLAIDNLKEITALKTAQDQAVASSVPGPEPSGLISENDELKRRLNELIEANRLLQDKEKVLALKLGQARAKAQGLEQICEEYKLVAEGRN